MRADAAGVRLGDGRGIHRPCARLSSLCGWLLCAPRGSQSATRSPSIRTPVWAQSTFPVSAEEIALPNAREERDLPDDERRAEPRGYLRLQAFLEEVRRARAAPGLYLHQLR